MYAPYQLSEHGAFHVPAQPTARRVPLYYLNRDVDIERRARIEQQIKRLSLTARRIRGVDGLDVPPSLHAQFFTNGRLASKLKPGEVGCYASHLLAMQAMLDNGDDYAVILEDDAVIDANFAATVLRAVQHAPMDWSLINLCRNPTHATRTIAQLDDTHQIVRCSRLPAGMVGYLVSRRGAELITAARKRHFPSDVELRAPWLFDIDVYCLVPQIVGHDDQKVSVIGKLGGQSRLRRGLPIPTSYCWTGNPLHSPRSILYNMRKLGLVDWSICAASNIRRLVHRRLGDWRERRSGIVAVRPPGLAIDFFRRVFGPPLRNDR